MHDAIFISGARGTGKTAFLHNIEQYWDEIYNKNKAPSDKQNLKFCPIIDPTLLIDNDNFVNVVIAHLHNQVQLEKSSQNLDEYYKKLNKLADSLGQTEYKQELNGLDRIISYQSGIQLEHHFQEFVEECAKLFKVEAIVILFDDVDMALNKTHELLETIRRLLSCPKILPIVCGDNELYKSIMKDHFKHAGNKKWEIRKPIPDQQYKQITEEYLLKVFPSHLRIKLLPLDLLIDNIYLGDNKSEVTANHYMKNVRDAACPLVNGEENSYSYPEPTTSRELIQTIKLLKSSLPIPKDNTKYSIKKEHFWNDYAILCEARDFSIGELVVESEQELVNKRENQDQKQPYHPLQELSLFNVLKQIEFKNISRKNEIKPKYYDELKAALKNITLKYGQDSKWVNAQHVFIEHLNDKNKSPAISMPPVEFYISGLSIAKPQLEITWNKLNCSNLCENLKISIDEEKISNDEKEARLEIIKAKIKELNDTKMMLALYTHYYYYSSANKRTTQLFYGKAFELLSEGLLLGGDTNCIERDTYWVNTIEQIIHKSPFHSVYSLNSTKSMDYENEEMELGYDSIFNKFKYDTNSPCNQINETPIEQFAKDITEWEKCWTNTLKEAQKLGLSHLLSFVMNKVFSQLHEMRIKGTFKNDSLPYAIKRFEYIIINAFASFLKPGNVVKQNIALTDNLEGLIDSKYQTSDASIKQNIIEFIGERDSKDTETNERNINADIIKRLLRAIWNHPIFNLFDDTKDETTILLLGKQPGLDKSKDEIQKLKAGLDNYTVKDIMNFSFEKVENMIHNFEKLESKIYNTTGNDFKFSTEFGSRNKKYPALLERYRELNLLMNKPSDGVKFGQNIPRF